MSFRLKKNIFYGLEARKALQSGINKLAKAVIPTLGPLGRNVIIEDKLNPYGRPKICSDGVTVAKSIDLQDPMENIGAQFVKQASEKTNNEVGDGTTTTILITQAILNEAFKQIEAGASNLKIRDELEKARDIVLDKLFTISVPVYEKKQINHIASLSAHSEEIGSLITEALERIGRKGNIILEETKSTATEIEYLEGYHVDRKFINSYFTTNENANECVLENPAVLLVGEKIESIHDLVPILNKLTNTNRSLFLICEDLTETALTGLALNHQKGILRCLPIKATATGQRKLDILEDIAILTGAAVISSEVSRDIRKAELNDLGKCAKVVSKREGTTIIGGAGNPKVVEARIRQLNEQVKFVESEFDKDLLRERAAKMSNGVAIIKLGGHSDIEVQERKSRVEDAIYATKAAIEKGIVPGGGNAYLLASEAITKQDIGATILKLALEGPIKQIAANSGYNSYEVLWKVKDKIKDDIAFGFDASTGEYGDLYLKGIIDPTKVVESVIKNAVSVASTVLTSEAIIRHLDGKNFPK